MSAEALSITSNRIKRYEPYPEYEYSGVEWLEEIPSHWEVQPLKFTATINPEELSASTPFDYEIIYIDIGSVTLTEGIVTIEEYLFEVAPSRARRLVKHGDTILSTVRTYLKAIAYINDPPENLIASTGFAVIRPTSELHPEFLSRFVQSEPFVNRVVKHSGGVSYPAIVPSKLGRFDVLVPPLSEQRAIGSFLDRETAKIDALIAKKERLIELLQEKRRALITNAVTKGLDPNVPMKDSGISYVGEIPEHWDMIPLKFATAAKGGSIKAGPFGSQLLLSEMMTGTIKVYNQRNVIEGDFLKGENFVTEAKYLELEDFTIMPSDVLVTTRGTIGRCAVFPAIAETGVLHPCLMRVQTNKKKLIPRYLVLLIQDSGIVQQQLLLMSNATTIDVIYSDSLKNVKLLLPPIYEQERILSELQRKIAKMDVLIQRTQNSIQKLFEYRTALISAAVTGKIDLREEGS